MVWSSPVPEPTRDDRGWLCSADGCSNVAIQQIAAVCTGCSAASAEHLQRHEQLRADAHQLLLEASTTEAALTDVDADTIPVAAALLVVQQRAQAAVLTRQAQSVLHTAHALGQEHTHPVFACQDHLSLVDG